MAAAARPEPIRSGLKPGLPLGLQRVFHPCLTAPVGQHWDSERARSCHWLSVHTPAGPGMAGVSRCWHARAPPSRLGLAGQRDQPVDPRRPAACVALRHLPHADQRVAPAPQHESLQAPGARPVAFPYRLEDPAAQPPYLLLMVAPVRTIPGVTIEWGQALRSVHQGVQRALWCWHLRCFLFQGSPAHVSALSSPGSNGPASGPVIRGHPGKVPALPPRFAAAFRPPGIRFLGTPIPPGDSAPITVGLPHRLRIPAPEMRTLARFPLSARVRPGPGRAPSIPRGQRCLLVIGDSVTAACRLSTAGPCHPGTATQPGMCS